MTAGPLIVETVVADGARYRVAWFDPPFLPPPAETTQALGICFTRDSQIVLVTWNDADWTLPGGTIEPGETLEQTLAREVWEEACARVLACAYIGCQRVEHLDDDRPGYYQTRFWASVELEPFKAAHEMTARKLVRPDEFLDTLFWGRETTAALILERGLRIQAERAADPAHPARSESLMDAIARDGSDLLVSSNGGDWRVGWCPPPDPPPGMPHGAAAVCVSGDRVVLVSRDGRRWGLPGGRPEQGERWIDTLRREVGEEACAVVESARLLGFTRGVCVRGPEEGLVLVRSMWRAEVRLERWAPRFEIAHRRLVPAEQALRLVVIAEPGVGPIYRRMFVEAGFSSVDRGGRADR